MFNIEIRTKRKHVGQMTIVNTGCRTKNGKTKYDVTYTPADKSVFKSTVTHFRADGAMKLMAIACKAIARRIDAFYSIPEDKVIDGAIRSEDIPERYGKELGKFLGVHTGIVIDGKCATFVSDIQGFLTMKKSGIVPEWD